MGPHASVGIGAFVVQEIVGRHEELHGAAALDEHNVIVRGEMHQLAKQVFRFVQHVLEFFGTMADFCNSHACSFEIG